MRNDSGLLNETAAPNFLQSTEAVDVRKLSHPATVSAGSKDHDSEQQMAAGPAQHPEGAGQNLP